MTAEDIDFLRDTARNAGFLAGLEAAAKIADGIAVDEDYDSGGNPDKRIGAINVAEAIRFDLAQRKKALRL